MSYENSPNTILSYILYVSKGMKAIPKLILTTETALQSRIEFLEKRYINVQMLTYHNVYYIYDQFQRADKRDI